MKRSNFEKIMNSIYEIKAELFIINHSPKFKVGQEVIVIGYGIESKIIKSIELMGGENPAWFYSFGVSQDSLREDRIYLKEDI